MARLSKVTLQGARSCVRPEFSGMPSDDLETIIEGSISGLPADAVDDFTKALGSFGKTVGSGAQGAAPSIAQGAATGATVGGPWGALIGAGAGLASASLRKKGPRPTAPVPPVGVMPVAAGTPASPPVTSALPTGQGAAATVLSLLQDPTVQQALLSQVLGASGSQEVQTASGTSLPRAAINNLLTQLIANSSESLPESDEAFDESYLQDESGEYLVDPASPEQQAALVLSHLQYARSGTRKDDIEQFADASMTESAEWAGAESAEAVEFY